MLYLEGCKFGIEKRSRFVVRRRAVMPLINEVPQHRRPTMSLRGEFLRTDSTFNSKVTYLVLFTTMERVVPGASYRENGTTVTGMMARMSNVLNAR